MFLLKILAGICLLYLVGVFLMALMQDRLLFQRWAMREEPVLLPVTAERLSVDVAGVGQMVGVLLPADREAPAEAALLLGFGGNAWDADRLAIYLNSVFPTRNVVTFHYRGYGPSASRPSAEAFLEDATRIYDEVGALRDAERVVAIGLSLGSGPAVHLSSERAVSGLILVTRFDSLQALASDLYPWLPVRLLLRHRMDVADALAQSSAKIAIGAESLLENSATKIVA